MGRTVAPKAHASSTHYQRTFWITALRWLPHRILLSVATHYGWQPITRRLEIIAVRRLGYTPQHIYSDAELAAYRRVISGTRLWHGAGRLQYIDNRAQDIFEAVLAAGELRTAHDHYAILLAGNPTNSLSATPLRIIARSYADTHGQGERECSRYGSSMWWVAYYYSLFYAEIFTRHGLTVLRNKKRWHQATANTKGQRTWGRKVNRSATSVWDIFGSGSDIPGNYPILYGIASIETTALLPRSLAKTEVRITTRVPLRSLSHIEVPDTYVEKTRALLRAANLQVPVFPLEIGEIVASQTSFGMLIGKIAHSEPQQA